MTMKNPLLVPELRTMLAGGDTDALRDFCETLHPAVVAELASALSEEDAWAVLTHADLPLRAEIFSHMADDIQADIIATLHRQDIARLMTEMPPDDRADLFRRLPEDSREAVLPALAQAEREDIRRLASYEEGTAGAAMTSDYATLGPHLTAAQAIERLREIAPDRETIYYAYVVDENRRLLGFVSLKDLIVAKRDARVSDLMHRDAVSARVDDDQEDAARKIQKYDLLALPVIDGADALVGIVTYDDAIDIITQEHTEDMEKFMAIAGSHEEAMYMRTPPWVHFRNRAPWVAALAVLGLVSGFIVQSFEGLLMQFAILAAFMPMVADTGGNTGSQSATLVIRALALREIAPRDALRILFKEFQVAILLALLLGMLAFGRVVLFGGGSSMPLNYPLATIGIAIAIALGLQVVTSTLIGAVLPLAAARAKLDPAVVASPALTTAVDITGLLIYFTTAKILLGI
ncbi:magnesium transporter [Candidatus Fermentibacteria bacterium]|nr:magnesium transporter [Candidatus Fermentibacteria bacterium]